MRMLVFGNGWLGNLFSRKFDAVVSDADILDMEAVGADMFEHQPDVVVNAAAKCGSPNIDWCEKTPENRRLTWYVNALGPALLHSFCRASRRDVKFVHLSSGCLWTDGVGMTEKSRPIPPSWYSTTKLIGEEKLLSALDMGAIVMRLRMPIDREPHPRNYITKLASFKKVVALPNSYTIVDDMLDALAFLLEKDASGVFHVVNGGSMTAEEILKCYCRKIDPDHTWQRVMMEELHAAGLIKATRSSCVISNAKLRKLGYRMKPLRQRLPHVMDEYAEAIK